MGRLFKATLLVAGTAIGGGMLALPVVTSPAGLLPTLFMFFVCWAFMALTGLLTMEVYLAFEGDVNFVSMAERTLGAYGKYLAWVLYIFLFYTLSLAYVLGCGQILAAIFPLKESLGPLVFLLGFIPLPLLGAKISSRVNVLFMVGLFLCYVSFLAMGMPFIEIENLAHRDWSQILNGLPVAFGAFGFHGVIPTVANYLERDGKKISKAIVWGSFIPLLVYTLWEVMILGIFSLEDLLKALENGETAVAPLRYFLGHPAVFFVGQFFAFFCLITSFLGVSLGLVDFLADGLGIKKTQKGKIGICSMIFVPVALLAYIYPSAFLDLFDLAGGFGAALLLGLLPIMMAWGLRYKKGQKSPLQIPGGKTLLAVLALFVTFELVLEVYHLILKLN